MTTTNNAHITPAQFNADANHGIKLLGLAIDHRCFYVQVLIRLDSNPEAVQICCDLLNGVADWDDYASVN